MSEQGKIIVVGKIDSWGFKIWRLTIGIVQKKMHLIAQANNILYREKYHAQNKYNQIPRRWHAVY